MREIGLEQNDRISLKSPIAGKSFFFLPTYIFQIMVGN
jgi:hypothetical protein